MQLLIFVSHLFLPYILEAVDQMLQYTQTKYLSIDGVISKLESLSTIFRDEKESVQNKFKKRLLINQLDIPVEGVVRQTK